MVLAGLGLLLAALGLIVAALAEAAMALFLAGTAAGGVAAGAIFLGSLATANRLASAALRWPGAPHPAATSKITATTTPALAPTTDTWLGCPFITSADAAERLEVGPAARPPGGAPG